MRQCQVDFGKKLITGIAKKWGIPIERAAHILIHSRDAWNFYEWVNADEFLTDELWREE